MKKTTKAMAAFGSLIAITMIGQSKVSAETEQYTIKKGDTLYAISNSYGVDMNQLAEVNGIDLNDLIFPDQKLIIPSSVVTTTQTQTYEQASTKAYGGELTSNQYEILLAVVQQEAGSTSYEAQLAVMSVITNRVDVQYDGSNVWETITASGQFEAYGASHYVKHLGNISDTTRKAVQDGLSGVKSVPYTNFWSAGYARMKGQSGVNIGGNVFFNM